MRRILTGLLLLVIAVFSVEATLQLIARVPLKNGKLVRIQEILNNESITPGDESCWENSRWKKRFVRDYADGRFFQSGLLEVNPQLGWLPKANVTLTLDGLQYTLNAKQERWTGAPDSGAEIWVFGDSFTFGMDADDSATWPYMLQQKTPQLRVRNFAVPGYGVDQMYLRLRAALEQGRPKAVIVAMNLDDFLRTSLNFRDYQKPLFVAQGDEIELTNVPVPPPNQLYTSLAKQLSGFHFMTAALTQNLFETDKNVLSLQQTCHKNSLQVCRIIFEKMLELSQQQHFGLAFVYLPKFEENQSEKFISVGENFFNDSGSVLEGHFFNLRPLFLKIGWDTLNQSHPKIRPGHYTHAENALVAESLSKLFLTNPE